ncbi:GNAT family N-acetyltransferase [Flavobacterium silvaticum]|uniref:GNAT family N-acetyltransferase n=1 Tax=Flavobacterium silvaticum TaxID=1852020 RepID=A0A972FKL3_9FLAO|nr:GNAT family N-acetyltransferase [Flavobacterium silvaticum]NMH27759.1 GNAT family N-acetyltransferase [Flavobacterium silvaticum]
MIIRQKKLLDTFEKIRICQIWNCEYPVTLNYENVADFEMYLNSLSDPNHYLLIGNDDTIQGWACTFSRNDSRWFAILLDTEIHGKGFGSQMLSELKKAESDLSGWVIDRDSEVRKDGSFYKSPLDFYLKNQFRPCAEERLETEKISAVKIFWKR